MVWAQPVGEAKPLAILAQPLGEALNELAAATSTPIAFSQALVEGKVAPGIHGTMTVGQAVNRLLSGSGLIADQEGAGFLIKAAPTATPGAAQSLAPVTVTAQSDRNGLTEDSGSYTTRSSNAATGMNLSLRETPQSVTVVTRQRMDDQGLDSLGSVLEQAPGISSAVNSGPALGGYAPVYARGYRINNYQIDGVATPSYAWSSNGWTGGASMDTAIYDSIILVRGATGLLTGAGDPSASINLLRKRPTAQLRASVSQSLGRWGQHRTVGDVGGPLNASGSLRGRVVAAYEEAGSQVARYQGYKSIFYGVLEADLGSKTLLNLAVEHGRETGNGAGSYTGFDVAFTNDTRTPFSRNDNALADWSNYHSVRTTLSGRLEHRFNPDWQARLGYSYSKRNSDYKFGYAGVGVPDPDGMSNMMLRQSDKDEQRVQAIDFRLEGRFPLAGRTHDLVAGFNASDADLNYPRSINNFNAGRVQTLGWDGSYREPDWSMFTWSSTATRTQQSGAYFATRLRPTDRLSVIAGARWSSWKTQARNLVTDAVTDDRKESGVFSPYAALMLDFTRNLTAYASYTEIFNPQTFQDVSGRMLAPEKGKNYELGMKGEWFNGRLNGSAAVFQVKKDNLAILDGNNRAPDGSQAYTAADDTDGQGWEVETSGELARNWGIQAGYTRMVLKDSRGAPLSTNFQPKHQFKLFTTWSPAALRQLTVGGGVLWQSEIYTSGTRSALRDIYAQKGYAIVNLMGRYAFSDRISLTVNLNNLFDKVYRTNTSRHEYGAGRYLLATLRYQL